MEQLDRLPSKFEFSLSTTNKDLNLCDTLKFGEETVHYLDSLLIYYYNASLKCHQLTIKKNHELTKSEKLLIHLKLKFNDEKYQANELASINQWKTLHEETGGLPIQFVTFKKNCTTVQELPGGVNRMPYSGTFLWDCAQLSAACEFYVYFGFHSTQFPVRVNNNHYVGCLFDLLVEIYSVESKQKLDSFSFKLKISRDFQSQYKADLESQKKMSQIEVTKNVGIENHNLVELLASLSMQTLPPVNPLPSDIEMNKIILDRAYFKYEISQSCSDQYTLPVAYVKFPLSNRGKKLNCPIIMDGTNFKSANEGQLVKTVFTLGLNKQFQANEWLQNWQRVNVGKRLLQYFFDYRVIRYYDNQLFDIYSSNVNQFTLIWMPSKSWNDFSIEFNVCDDNELDYHKFECYLKAETFRYEDNAKIDEALCRIEFNKTCPVNGLTVHKTCQLKNEAKYLIKKVLFITVDGSDYTPLCFQQCFVAEFNLDQFKANLTSLIQRIKNMDPFQLGKLRYFKFGQTDDQAVDFNWLIFNSLEPKAALKCVLNNVSNERSVDQKEEIRYNIDLISQQ